MSEFFERNNDTGGLAGIAIESGTYPIGAALHESGAGGVYESVYGKDARPAAIKIRRADAPDSGELLGRWRKATGFSDARLLRAYAAGSAVVDGVGIVYLVMERAEESLAGVLAVRPLSETETREMLRPTLAALRYLHSNGYAHSNLKASNILAVGEEVKLSSEDATPIGAGGTAAEDMRALGSLIVEALTQKPPEGESGEPYVLRDASDTLADIVRHCLDPNPDKRWTVEQVEARLDGLTVVPEDGRDGSLVQEAPAEAISVRTPRWVFAALAALLLVVGLTVLLRRKDAGSAAATQPAAASAPAPVIITQATKDGGAQSSPAKPGTRRGEGWSVIVASYSARQAAEKRLRQMSRKWPRFKWSVFEQHAAKTYYLVVIGENLSEDEAETLRKRAVYSGLPGDTYIRKVS